MDCVKNFFVLFVVNLSLFLVNVILIFFLFFVVIDLIDFRFLFGCVFMYVLFISEGICIVNFILEFGLIVFLVNLKFLYVLKNIFGVCWLIFCVVVLFIIYLMKLIYFLFI